MFKPVSEVTNHLLNFFSTGSPPRPHRCQGEIELPAGASQKGRVVLVLVFGFFFPGSFFLQRTDVQPFLTFF